jgi:hypothetical protein
MVARRLQPPALDALPAEPLIQTGGADQSVDDRGQCRHLAEGQAKQRGHEIESRDRHEPPVQRPHYDEHRRDHIDDFQVLPPVFDYNAI